MNLVDYFGVPLKGEGAAFEIGLALQSLTSIIQPRSVSALPV